MAANEEILKQVFEANSKVFGVKSKPRFDMLKWSGPAEDRWDYKANSIKAAPETKKYTYRINHDRSDWKSEMRDNYKQIVNIGGNQLGHEIDPNRLRELGQQQQVRAPHPPAQAATYTEENYMNPPPPPDPYKKEKDWYPKLQSNYRDEYQVKDIKTQDQLLDHLGLKSGNSFSKIYDSKARTKTNLTAPQTTTSTRTVRSWRYQQLRNQQKGPADGDFNEDEEEVLEELEDQMPNSASDMKRKKLVRKARKLDPNNPEDLERLKRRQERIKQLHNTTRWLPNTAFSTYFGKPAWGPYGYGNIKPSIGGVFYGQHMYSHNVQPHRFVNDPQYQQSYNNALRFSNNLPEAVPEPPRNCKEEYRLNPEQVDELKKRNPLTLEPFNDTKKNITDSRGKIQVPAKLTIKKPDLVNSMRFASEEGSEVEEVVSDPKQPPKPKTAKENQLPSQEKQQTMQASKTIYLPSSPKNPNQKRPSSAQAKPKEAPITQNEIKAKQKKDSKKVGFKNGKVDSQIQPKSDQKRKVDQDDQDSLKLPDKSQRKFIDEMKKKKEKSMRLAPKINQINPSLLIQKSEILQTAAPVISKDLEEIKQIDPMNPTQQYISSLYPTELNPKYYKHIPPEWLNRIPFAGKRLEREGDAKECFDFGY